MILTTCIVYSFSLVRMYQYRRFYSVKKCLNLVMTLAPDWKIQKSVKKVRSGQGSTVLIALQQVLERAATKRTNK